MVSRERAPAKDSHSYKLTDQPVKDRTRQKDKPRRDRTSTATASGKPKSDLRAECRGCGHRGHKRDACRGKDHPDYNTADCEWEDSEAMKAIRTHQLKDEKGIPLTVLPWNKRVDGTPYSGLKWERPQTKKPRSKGRSLCGSCHAHDLMILDRYGDERLLHTSEG